MKAWEIAMTEFDTEEIVGPNHNPKILEYAKEIGASWVTSDETGWCAIFLQWCLKRANLKYSYHANARYFLNYGEKTEQPELGDIVVFWRIAKASPYGHVGFYIKEDQKYVWVLGGNQSNKVTITKFNKTQVLDYRKILDN